jgi:hypothetical protein
MLQNIFSTIWQLPMVWHLILPLVMVGVFCAILYWEAEHGEPGMQ